MYAAAHSEQSGVSEIGPNIPVEMGGCWVNIQEEASSFLRAISAAHQNGEPIQAGYLWQSLAFCIPRTCARTRSLAAESHPEAYLLE